ncbi:MAG: hypothetical protein J6N52_13140 [Clostridia bacterium]|nr:hypothetical protein [Clostridia bacterium]
MSAFYHNGNYISCTDESYRKYASSVCRSLKIRRIKNVFRQIIGKIKNRRMNENF